MQLDAAGRQAPSTGIERMYWFSVKRRLVEKANALLPPVVFVV
jgi:hypothetical protein